jgi:stage V sporulation protein B
MSKKALIIGTLILTTANFVTKFMGFFYRVYMAKAIGTEGIGLYQLILPIYMLTWSITSSGFTTTISKLTAQEKAKGQYGNIRRILRQSIAMCLCISIFISCVIWLGSNFIAIEILKESRTALSLRILAFAIPFMSFGSCIRGYFFGMQNTAVPALSQVLEQLVRIVVIFLISATFVPYGLAYACAAAVIGIVFGEIISFLFVLLCYLRDKKKKKHHSKPYFSRMQAFTLITTMAIPLTATRITSSLLSTIENILIPQRLELYGLSGSEAMSTYGQLTGMAMPLLMLPSALLMAISVSLVPEISEASAIRHTEKISRTVSATILFTSIISIGAGTMFAIFPKEICYIIYNSSELGDILFCLSFICPFLYMQMTFSGLLNGLGEHFFLFRNNIISSLITISFIYFLMPTFGVSAFLIGWFCSLVSTTYLSIRKLLSRTNISISLMETFIKPLMAGVASGLIVRYLIQISEPSKILFIMTLSLMFLLYLVFLLVLGCLKKETFSLIRG